jgi:hypothetical protein
MSTITFDDLFAYRFYCLDNTNDEYIIVRNLKMYLYNNNFTVDSIDEYLFHFYIANGLPITLEEIKLIVINPNQSALPPAEILPYDDEDEEDDDIDIDDEIEYTDDIVEEDEDESTPISDVITITNAFTITDAFLINNLNNLINNYISQQQPNNIVINNNTQTINPVDSTNPLDSTNPVDSTNPLDSTNPVEPNIIEPAIVEPINTGQPIINNSLNEQYNNIINLLNSTNAFNPTFPNGLDAIHFEYTAISNQPINNNQFINLANTLFGTSNQDIVVTTDEEDINKLNTITIDELIQDKCSICMTEFEKGDTLLDIPCKHKFHKDCLSTYLQQYNHICPVCRTDIGKTKINY